MLRFIGRRLLSAVPITLGVSIICFMLIHLVPGDPASAMIPDNTSPQIAAQIRAAYGFDKPLPVQYLLWLGHVISGDFGLSLQTRRPVLNEIGPAVANTFKIAAGATIISCLLGSLLGALAAWRLGKASDRSISAIGIAGMSVPQYWLGMVLISLFAVKWHVLPATGMGEPTATFGERLSFVILPTVTLATVPTGIIARNVRSAVADVLQQEFVQTLHANGLPQWRVWMHVARNASPAVLAVMGLQFAYLLGGSILVETVFSWPGAGLLLDSAIFMRDLPVVQGTVLVLAVLFIIINLTVDLLQIAIDPRFRHARLRER